MKTFYLLAVLINGFEVTEQTNIGAFPDVATCNHAMQEIIKANDPYGYICHDKPVWENEEQVNPNAY